MYQTILNMYEAILSIPTALVNAFNSYMLSSLNIDLSTIQFNLTLWSDTPWFSLDVLSITQIVVNGIFAVGVVVLTFKIIKRFWRLLKF